MSSNNTPPSIYVGNNAVVHASESRSTSLLELQVLDEPSGHVCIASQVLRSVVDARNRLAMTIGRQANPSLLV